MAVDFFMFLIPFTPGDYLFVGHHLMTFGYMLSSLVINRGGLSCLILMVLGECTSLFQNSWLISRELRHESNVSISACNVDDVDQAHPNIDAGCGNLPCQPHSVGALEFGPNQHLQSCLGM